MASAAHRLGPTSGQRAGPMRTPVSRKPTTDGTEAVQVHRQPDAGEQVVAREDGQFVEHGAVGRSSQRHLSSRQGISRGNCSAGTTLSVNSPRADHCDRRRHADALVGERAVQVVDAGHRLVVEADDDVALLHAGASAGPPPRSPARGCRLDRRWWTRATWRGSARSARRGPGSRAECARRGSGASRRSARCRPDGEADALRRADDRGVDADHLAARVDQRPARVAGIERRVGLDDVVHQAPRVRAQRAPERASPRPPSRCTGSRADCRSRSRAAPRAGRPSRPATAGSSSSAWSADDREVGVGIVAHQRRRTGGRPASATSRRAAPARRGCW